MNLSHFSGNPHELSSLIRPRRIQKLCVEIRGRLWNLVRISEGKAKAKWGSNETVKRLTIEINERLELLLEIRKILSGHKELEKSIFGEFIDRETQNGARQNRTSNINITWKDHEYLTSIMAVAWVSPTVMEHFLLQIIHRNIEKRNYE